MAQIAAAAASLFFVFLCIALVFWRLRQRVPADAPVPSFAGAIGLSSVALATGRAGGVAPRSDDEWGAGESPVQAVAGVPRAHGDAELAQRLEPAARLLGASGLIVWTCSPDGRHLEVTAAYGYSDAFLGRIGPIELGAPVLTSVAFVEGRTRIRGRNNNRLAAIAVPIERDHVRLGVLTAEIDASRGDRVSADSAAMVQLLASQMSGSLVALSPLAARAAAAATARGPSSRPQTEVLPAYEAAPSIGLPSAPTVPSPQVSEDDSDSALREARSRFIAGFRKRCSSIEELIVEVEQRGTDGPLPALKQIVHRLSGLAIVVGMQEVSARAAELDLLLDAPRASVDSAPLRRAFENMQDAFTTDLSVVAPVWAAPSGQAVGALVMLVTSDAELASRMTADLQSSAYRVTQTGSGHRALLVARSERPDMMLLDVDLAGEMDGHGVCRRLKNDPALASIPIVLVSSHTSTADRMAGFALGADDFLTKPVQTIEMLLRVRWILTRPSTERQPPPRAGGGLLTYDAFVSAARDVLQQGAAALGVVRVSQAQMPDLAALFSDDLRRKDLLGRYTDTQLVVLMPGATAGVASRRIGGVLDIARAAGLDTASAGVTASGLSSERFIEPLLAQAESALSAAQVQGEALVVHGSAAGAND